MKKILLYTILLLVALPALSQAHIKLEEAKDHIGDSVTVCGKVASARYVESNASSPTLLNLGARYPGQLLTVVIWPDIRRHFEGKPEEIYLDKEICITGRIELYKDRPQVVIRNTKQIQLKE